MQNGLKFSLCTHSIELLIWITIWKRILTHGTGFRIIMRRINVQIQKVFCSVLPNTKIPGGGKTLTNFHYKFNRIKMQQHENLHIKQKKTNDRYWEVELEKFQFGNWLNFWGLLRYLIVYYFMFTLQFQYFHHLWYAHASQLWQSPSACSHQPSLHLSSKNLHHLPHH